MRFNRRSGLEGSHAILSPSQSHWLNYDDVKLTNRFHSLRAARRGTDLHDFAQRAIELGVKMPRTKTTLNLYINDGIKFGMECEVPLYYSENCFGHADAACFNGTLLRIHDLKTGITPAKAKQLEIYAALFCLEYMKNPFDIDIELRIYQNDDIRILVPYSESIAHIMEKIVDFDQKIKALKEETAW